MFIRMKDCSFCNLNNIEHSTEFFNIIYDERHDYSRAFKIYVFFTIFII